MNLKIKSKNLENSEAQAGGRCLVSVLLSRVDLGLQSADVEVV